MIKSEAIAIYSRKSKFTGKGESIENQIELCRQYIKTHFPAYDENGITVYEDEGYSGGHTDRPRFKDMMNSARNKGISVIVCYRLDRISRNIGDFAKLIEELNSLQISFVSIKEQFDTSSPIGRAMMYIASVFSQLERETIAERIRDNMLELAKTGRWLGGNTPTGYSSEPVEKLTVEGKIRRAFKLTLIPEEANLVRTIYGKFLEENSLTKVETYLLQNCIVTKNGRRFTRFSIRNILENPVYLIADEDAFKYYEAMQAELFSGREAFDSIHGIMAYNKTIQKKGKANQTRDLNEWIIAVGRHEGIISGADWTQAQRLLIQNKPKAYRKPKSNAALLSGILFCVCGAYMRPKRYGRKTIDGEPMYSYLCETKEKSHCQNCSSKNPNGNLLDKLVCDEIMKLPFDKSIFAAELEKARDGILNNTEEYNAELDRLESIAAETEKEINTLLTALARSPEETHEYITRQIGELHNKNILLQERAAELDSILQNHSFSNEELSIKADLLCSFAKIFGTMNIEQKRAALRMLIHKITWDGEAAHLYLFGDEPQSEYSK